MVGVEERAGPRVLLASRSARRRELLAGHGYDFDVADSAFDDGHLAQGEAKPEAWVMSLAYLKAAAAAERAGARGGVVIGADTVCVHEGRVIGQPRDGDEARRVLRSLRGVTHAVLTGVALVCPESGRREMFCDRSAVTLGDVADEEIEAYVAGGQWRGKAGAYNLAERLEAGWPIGFEGDPTSIMGLPMRALGERLARFRTGG